MMYIIETLGIMMMIVYGRSAIVRYLHARFNNIASASCNQMTLTPRATLTIIFIASQHADADAIRSNISVRVANGSVRVTETGTITLYA